MATNRNNLGPKVSTRAINWMDQVNRAWGSELHAPDRGIYEFGKGRKFDSTDQGRTGIYGVDVPDDIIMNGDPYPDMRDGLLGDLGGARLGSLNNGFGAYDNIAADYNSLTAGPDPAIPYTDPYFQYVTLLVHGDEFRDRSQYGVTLTPSGPVSISPPNQGIFGNQGSILCDTIGTTGHLVTPSNTRYGIGTTEAFTFEFWAKIIEAPPVSNSCQFLSNNANTLGCNMGNPGGPSWLGAGAGQWASTPNLNVWNNYIVAYNSQISRRFFNGILVNEQSASNVDSPASYFFDIVGTPGGTNRSLRAYFAEIRLTRGFCRYGAQNFQVQSRAWPNQGPT
jgi:hypothetical protein